MPEWHNQIPVASGLVDDKKHKRTAVDLVRMDGDAAELAELIELKWESDTPLFALFEVLLYGLALLLSRRNAKKFGYRGLPLIEAPVVRLAVLAPSQYYQYYDDCRYDCRKYADVISAGLQLLRDTHSDLPEMSFRFLRFPICIDKPLFNNRAEVKELKLSRDDDPRRVKLRKAMSALEPVWED